MPDLDVPNAAPIAEKKYSSKLNGFKTIAQHTAEHHLCGREQRVLHPRHRTMRLTAAATPAKPKKGANGGHKDMVTMRKKVKRR